MVNIQSVSITLAALSFVVAASYYIMTLNYTRKNQQQQLETRQAQMFMGLYNQMNRVEFIDAWRALQEISWNSFEEFQSDMEDPELSRHGWVLGMFFEPLGVFVKNDLIPIRLVAETMAGMTRLWWEKFIPIIEEGRKKLGIPRWYSETEYLYNALMKYMDEHPELAT